jgi:phosphate transport system substrate-binding protein
MTFTASNVLFLITTLIASVSAKADTIKIDGSSTVFPVTEAVAEEFRTSNSKVKITIGVSGTGGGFKKFANGEIDINNASRPFKDKEIAAAATKGINFFELPVAYDGLSIIVNKKNKFVDSLSIDQLKKIWEPGSKIKTWKDVNPAWPDKKIALYGPGPDSGTFDYFTEIVVGTARAMRSDFTSSEDDHVIVNGVTGDEFALGYLGFAYFQENSTKLKALSVDGGKGAIHGEDKTISDGTYPISRPLFIVISSKAAERQEVKDFVNFYLKNAAKLSKEVGYTALPSSMYDDAIKRFQSGKTGNWMTTSH